MGESNIAYYDCNDEAEYLSYEEKDEAIEAYLDDLEDLPEYVMVYGFKRQTVDVEKFKKAVLAFSNEWLGEQYDGEDGHDVPTEAEKPAEDFVKSYLANYTVWNCDKVTEEYIDVKTWCANNRPDYLES